jgi:alpha-glucosidase (family GH31 glycosyl hydrolase)
MAEALRGLLSLTASGFGFASHDIGGFEVCQLFARTQGDD